MRATRTRACRSRGTGGGVVIVPGSTGSARTRVDRNRIAVMGHATGGGGSLEVA